MAARVNKDEFEGKVLKSDIPVLVDFYSDSCVPCKKMTPVIGDVEDDMEGKLAVYKVNINFDTELAESRDKKHYRGKGKRKTCIKTVYGEVEYKRTVYRPKTEQGENAYIYLLDEAMQMDKIGLIFNARMNEIMETLSAAKTSKKDGKGNRYVELMRGHVPLIDAAATASRKAFRNAFIR